MNNKKIFRSLAVLALFLLAAISANAAKATQDLLTHNQSDGTELNFYLRGDEHFHYMETTDGYELVETAGGDLAYASRSASGEVQSTAQFAHNPAERTANETAFLASINKVAETLNRATASTQARAQRATTTPQRARSNASAVTGEIRIPVLLVEYSDIRFTIPNLKTEITNQLNQPGYSNFGHNGSVRDYFLDNSFGQFKPTFDVTNVVTLSKPRAYYGSNKDNITGNDQRPGTMIAEALQLADASFDFSRYDTNGDGYIDFLFVIYADCSEGDTGVGEMIWAHSWNMRDAAIKEHFTNPTVNGKQALDYFCTPELMKNRQPAGIGTICHEFCHPLGLPDLYDTDYEGSGGTNPGFGSWSLMDSGNNLNDGRTPPYLTAYERSLLGWGTSTALAEAGDYTLDHIKNGNYYRINTTNSYEYFLLENRQKTGWDSYLPGHGMLITRVYEKDRYYFDNNLLNAVKDQERVNLLEAYGAQKYGGYYSAASDPFPGNRNITRWDDDSSKPANSLLWNGSALGKPVFNIAESGSIISFVFIKQIDPFVISRSGNTLTIESKIDLKQIIVYNLLGRLLHQQKGQLGENTLQLPAGGNIYILKLDDKSLKIVM